MGETFANKPANQICTTFARPPDGLQMAWALEERALGHTVVLLLATALPGVEMGGVRTCQNYLILHHSRSLSAPALAPAVRHQGHQRPIAAAG